MYTTIKPILSAVLVALITTQSAFAKEKEKPKPPAKPITKIQFMAVQRAMFNKADNDYDGRITLEEAAQFKLEADTPRLKKKFAKLDTDHNGYLTHEEVRTAHEKLLEHPLGRKNKNSAKDWLLRKYDHDKNGSISSAELDAEIEKDRGDLAARIDKNTDRDFNHKDADKNGTVSLDEYIQSHKRGSFLGFGLKEGAISLKRDRNDDNIIARSENEKFIDELFTALDKDSDDELSAKEQANRAFKRSTSLNARSRFVINPDKPDTTSITVTR